MTPRPHSPQSVLFWTGAGISADAPSSLPLGDDLTRTVVTAVCSHRHWERVQEYFDRATMTDASGRPKRAPRLEAILETLDRRLQGNIVRGLGRILEAEPNDLHRFFAEHLLSGGVHVTMNFDELIEHCCQDLRTSNLPLALHGRLSDLSQRVTTSDLTSGIGIMDAREIQSALTTVDRFVFLGYSARDYFDVDPYFRQLATRDVDFSSLRVVWVDHATDPHVDEAVNWRRPRPLDGTTLLNALAHRGATVEYRRRNVREYLRELAVEWGFAVPAPTQRRRSSPPSTPWLATLHDDIGRRINAEERVLAGADLWSPMGIGRPVIEIAQALEESSDPARRRLHERTGEARRLAWAAMGRYRRAVRLARAIPDRAHRAHILGSYQRLRGALLRAGWHHSRALARYGQLERISAAKPLEQGSAQVEYLFWYRELRMSWIGPAIARARSLLVAMARALGGPGSRLLETYDPHVLFWALGDNEPYLNRHPHAIDQLARLHAGIAEIAAEAALPELVATRHVPGVGAYVETDSFVGYVNRERDALIARLEEGCLVPSPAEVAAHRERAEAIEDGPGWLKASIVLRRLRVVERFPARRLWRVGWTPLRTASWTLRWVWLGWRIRVGAVKRGR